jgi:hypothetical protein
MVLQKKTPKPKKRRDLYCVPDYCLPRPVIRNQRSYSRRRKQNVLLFLVHHRIPITTTDYHKPRRLADLPDIKKTGYRRPTAAEAARYFNVTRDTTIHT